MCLNLVRWIAHAINVPINQSKPTIYTFQKKDCNLKDAFIAFDSKPGNYTTTTQEPKYSTLSSSTVLSYKFSGKKVQSSK